MKTLRIIAVVFALTAAMVSSAAAEDVVELLSGAVVRGEVTARTATDITFKTTIAGQSVVRKFPLDRMHALTVGGKREVLVDQNYFEEVDAQLR